MNEKQAKKMDDAMLGPRLSCSYCGGNKVLSPCFYCQLHEGGLNQYCHGCGRSFENCIPKYEICWELKKEKILLVIDQTIANKEVFVCLNCYNLKKLPGEIGKLTQLQNLYFRNNQLSELPREIGKLTQLNRLELSNNQLSELPKEIGKLTQLRSMDLLYYCSF